jgi:hypothetical protein
MYRFITPVCRAASAALFLCLPAIGAHAVEAWSNAASAGTIDEASTALLSLTGTTVQFKTGKTGVATVRYAVNDVFPDSLNPSPKWIGLRFRDNGADARVTAQLFQQNYGTGTVTPVGPLVDSDAFTPSTSFQFNWRSDCAMALDFFSNSYWVEMTLTRGTTAGTPAVQQVRMDNLTCSGLAETEGGALRQ